MPMAVSELPVIFIFEELTQGLVYSCFSYQREFKLPRSYPRKILFQTAGMMPKKRKEFHTWYAAQVERNEEYDLWKELNNYCHSDVMVLKAACEAFIQKFQEEAGFNPMEKCATIASACNLFWRRELVPQKTIAIEPMNGRLEANMNKSHIALKWLCYEDSKLEGNRIRHVRNGREQKGMTPTESLFVDGYDTKN